VVEYLFLVDIGFTILAAYPNFQAVPVLFLNWFRLNVVVVLASPSSIGPSRSDREMAVGPVKHKAITLPRARLPKVEFTTMTPLYHFGFDGTIVIGPVWITEVYLRPV